MKLTFKLLLASVLTAAAVFLAVSFAPVARAADAMNCNLAGYQAAPGMTAAMEEGALVVTWDGANTQEVRMRLAINGGTPTIQDLAVRKTKTGMWATVAANAAPEFRYMSGWRRLDQEAFPALKETKGVITQEVLDHYKWGAFWDAPLHVPGAEVAHGNSTPPPDGIPGTNQPGLPRKPEEIRSGTAVYKASTCEVKTNGARLEITFPGAEMGIFKSGRLQYTVFKGTNLVRQELIAKTDEQSVAYKYDAGLKGLAIAPASKVVWRDLGNQWQAYQLEAAINQAPATLRTANRLVAAEAAGGSIALFPPPHNFFWTRETSNVLGYNWYRKDSKTSYSIGIKQAEGEDDPAYAGVGPEDRRQNFQLYNARPGSWQHMPVYIQVEAGAGRASITSALTYTRNDHYKAIPGYWVMARHFHTSPVPRLLGAGGLDTVLPDFELARATGINVFEPVGGGGIVAAGSTPIGPRQDAAAVAAQNGRGGRGAAEPAAEAPARGYNPANQLKGQELYYEMARLQSRKDFLVLPDAENAFGGVARDKAMGGHVDTMISHPVYWTNRQPGQPFVEDDPKYGKVYHVGDTEDMTKIAHAENMLFFTPHPDTKGSAGYPEAYKDKPFYVDDTYRGIGFRWGMDLDRSETRLSDYRCMPLFDTINNWAAEKGTAPKYMTAITETYEQKPGDDFYANNPVSYVKAHGTPGIDNWGPIVDAIKTGDFFVTSGEVLITNYSVQGVGKNRTVAADVEWTFPLEFVEVVWGDGKKTDRQIISATDLPAFGKKRFALPFDPTGKKWVRFAVWDAAGNGAFVQPIRLTETPTIARASR